jgi:hypothetical protein
MPARVPARPGADRPVARRLENKGDGEVNVVLQLGSGTEVVIKLPGRFKVSPQNAGAIKARQPRIFRLFSTPPEIPSSWGSSAA